MFVYVFECLSWVIVVRCVFGRVGGGSLGFRDIVFLNLESGFFFSIWVGFFRLVFCS